jgi:hydrogenase maturation protease
MRTLIIGYGNPLRGDDAVGWHIAQRLTNESEAQVIACHGLLPELAAAIAHADEVIFIDADVGKFPGEIQRQTVQHDTKPVRAMLHALTPGQLLATAASVYHRAPEAVIITITGARFDYGERISPLVQRAADTVVEMVRRLLARHRVEVEVHTGRAKEAYGYA